MGIIKSIIKLLKGEEEPPPSGRKTNFSRTTKSEVPQCSTNSHYYPRIQKF